MKLLSTSIFTIFEQEFIYFKILPPPWISNGRPLIQISYLSQLQFFFFLILIFTPDDDTWQFKWSVLRYPMSLLSGSLETAVSVSFEVPHGPIMWEPRNWPFPSHENFWGVANNDGVGMTAQTESAMVKPTAQKCHCKYSNVIVILVSLMANLSDITQSNRYSSISTNSTRQNFVSLGLGYFCIPNFGISLTWYQNKKHRS